VTSHFPDELSAYALGMLDAEDAAFVEAHLRGCDGCRAELVELREATDALDRLPVETFVHEPPLDDRALRRALRQMRAERRRGS
jgi:anti-sigma factor RsiW